MRCMLERNAVLNDFFKTEIVSVYEQENCKVSGGKSTFLNWGVRGLTENFSIHFCLARPHLVLKSEHANLKLHLCISSNCSRSPNLTIFLHRPFQADSGFHVSFVEDYFG